MGEEEGAAKEAKILCVSPRKQGNIIYVVGDGPVCTKDILWKHTIHYKKRKRMVLLGSAWARRSKERHASRRWTLVMKRGK